MLNKVLFDGIATQGTSKNPFHGAGDYAKYVLREALQNGYSFDIVLKNDLITDKNILKLIKQFHMCEVFYVDTINEVYELIKKGNYHTFYTPLPFNYKYFNLSNTKFIQVIHGLRSIELPWDYYRYKYYSNPFIKVIARIISSSKYLQNIIKKKHYKVTQSMIEKNNSVIYTVSTHSKHSLMSFYPNINHKDIKVFYSPFENINNNKKYAPIINGDYYLMVNANRFEKNIYRSIKSLDNLIEIGHLKNKTIVITGCNNLSFFKKIKHIDNFKLLPYVSNDEIESLYSNAFAFIYPSLNEGFGYPPLKAMGYGVPVIASCATSIPEICLDAALYFNPLSIDELSNRILQIEYNESIRLNLIESGYKRFDTLIKKQKQELPKMLKEIFGNV